MAWTDPSTWLAGAVVTAAKLNEQLRDNLKAIGDPWTDYTPAWTAPTNPSIGNGSLTGAFMRAGKLVHFRAAIVAGSTTSFGSGGWVLSLPVAAKASRWALQGIAFDASASAVYNIQTFSAGGTTMGLACDATTAGNPLRSVTSSAPFAWASGDTLSLHGTYEAA